ncbi:MAG: S-methyl-5-thioribose-1-phosphate isomerase, partial [archaeon]
MRPTAQNLFYAVDKVLNSIENFKDNPVKARETAVITAQSIALEDASYCERIGEQGLQLFNGSRNNVLTHCNAGWLAFVDWGSALSPIYKAKRAGKNVFVFADETRPRCQGARLTAWELKGEQIPFSVIADNASGYFMQKKEIDFCIVGSDRIASNGDVANKIGTYEKAVLAKENNIPFFVAAPSTTIDFSIESGSEIPIEERCMDEVLTMFGKNSKGIENIRLTPENVTARNPAFDVTPAKYVTGIITEEGLFKPSEIKSLKKT